MITLADPLPDDLETAHQLIRELWETLAQQLHLNAKLQHQLEQLLRQHYGRKSERIDPGPNVVIAERLPEPIEKGLPGPGLMAHVITNKYADHQPLYRQEALLQRPGVEI